MIARFWKGSVAAADADAYAAYMLETGVPGYTRAPGNQGVYMLRREVGDTYEFCMVSLWESMEAVRGFAGDEPHRAVFYPEDDRFLVERDLSVQHWEVHTHAAGNG